MEGLRRESEITHQRDQVRDIEDGAGLEQGMLVVARAVVVSCYSD